MTPLQASFFSSIILPAASISVFIHIVRRLACTVVSVYRIECSSVSSPWELSPDDLPDLQHFQQGRLYF
jgi:hypothetical protein